MLQQKSEQSIYPPRNNLSIEKKKNLTTSTFPRSFISFNFLLLSMGWIQKYWGVYIWMCLKTKLYLDTQLSESLTHMVKNFQNKNYVSNTQEHQFFKTWPTQVKQPKRTSYDPFKC